MDHTEEDRANVDTFIRVSDVKLGPCPVALLTPLLDIVTQCTKRISKRRLPSSEVQLQKNATHSGEPNYINKRFPTM